MIKNLLDDVDYDPQVRTGLIHNILVEQGLESHHWTRHALDNLLENIDNLPHAILIDGREGLGKLTLAQHLISHWLLSDIGNEEALKASIDRQHADLHVITTPYHCHYKLNPWMKDHAISYFTETQLTAKKPSQVIGIDQIRQLTQNIQLHALNAPYKIALIYPVDRLNTYAANALLKTLEEPAGDTKIILCADNLANVPETIRSRCMRVSLSCPTAEEATQWLNGQFINIDQASVSLILKLVHNAPLLAKEMIEANVNEPLKCFLSDLLLLIENKKNPLLIANQWIKSVGQINSGVSVIYQWLSVLFFDVYQQGIASNHQCAIDKSSQNGLQEYNHLISGLLNQYKLQEKEMPYESYRQLYLSAQNGNRLMKTATDHGLYLEQLLMKLYKLIL